MRRFISSAGLMLLIAASGCTFVDPETPSQEELYPQQFTPNDYIFRGGDGRVVNATFGPRAAIGPSVNVARVDDEDGPALRGVVFGKALVLSLSRARAVGLWGSEPLRVEVHRQEKRIRVEGL